jgi:hypothetical protein
MLDVDRLSSKQFIDTRNATFHFSFLELSKGLRKILIGQVFNRRITVYRRIAINLIIEDE